MGVADFLLAGDLTSPDFHEAVDAADEAEVSVVVALADHHDPQVRAAELYRRRGRGCESGIATLRVRHCGRVGAREALPRPSGSSPETLHVTAAFPTVGTVYTVALRPATRLAVLLVAMGSLAWAFGVLFDDWVLAIVLPLGYAVVGVWQARSKWQTRRMVADALRDHRDPGPGLREEVDQAAWVAAAGSRMGPWLTPLVAVGVAAACVAVAWVHSDPSAGLPAIPLVAWAVAVFVIMRRAVRLADLWLADPPQSNVAEAGA
jgi:hypothetical protein